MTTETLIVIAPEIFLALVAIIVYTGGLWIKNDRLWRWFALAGFLGAFFLWGISPQHVSHLAQREIVSDSTGDYFRALLWAAGFLLSLCQWEPLPGRSTAETVASILLAVCGAMLTTTAKDLILIFLGLELVSMATYVLLAIGRKDRLGREATFKYFFLSVLSSVVLLYGLSWLYGLGGSTDLASLAAAGQRVASEGGPLALAATLALVLVSGGLAFKAAAAPFHFYAPEVYYGTNYVNAALLSVVPKAAAVVVWLRIAGTVLPASLDVGWQLLAVLAAASLIVGNLGALLQQNLARLLAYSSIAHIGYMLLGLSAYLASRSGPGQVSLLAFDGATALGLYLLVYFLATVGVFAGLIALERHGAEIRQIADLTGAAWAESLTVRLAAWCMVICLFSLAGVPPLAGFWGKLAVFGSALSVPPAEAEAFGIFVALAIFAAINAAIGAAYYLRVVGAIVFSWDAKGLATKPGSGPLVATLVAAILTVAIGLWWQPWWRWAETASPRTAAPFVVAASETSAAGELGPRYLATR